MYFNSSVPAVIIALPSYMVRYCNYCSSRDDDLYETRIPHIYWPKLKYKSS
jgi:hypothetical protein